MSGIIVFYIMSQGKLYNETNIISIIALKFES
jgi:hypothetical protein